MGDTRKQIWKFQEGAVVLAAIEWCGTSKVHWDDTPDGMSIDPDVVVGDDPDHPDAVVFVTHATAERAGEKKFWRTVAEVIEAKRLVSRPRVISVLYASNVKDNLLQAYRALFDAVIHLDDHSWGDAFSKYLAQLTKSAGTQMKEKCLAVLAEQVETNTVPGWKSFAASVKSALSSQQGIYGQRIASSSFKKNGRVPSARETTLRRSLCKIYTFPAEFRKKLKSGVRLDNPPEHAVILEWVTKSIGGYRLTDPELNRFLDSANPDLVTAGVNHIDNRIPVFQEYVASLRNISGWQATYKWIIENYGALSTPSGMWTSLQQVYADPIATLKGYVSPELAPTDHWLFSSIIMLLRTETGRKDGYGYAQLGMESGHSYAIGALAGVTIAPYLQRKADLESNILQGIAKVFSFHLERIGKIKCAQLADSAVATSALSTFNFKLMNYRHYNPVDWPVCDRLESEGFSFDTSARHPSFLSESGRGTTTSTGNIISVNGGQCWIKCQSAYDGRIDKRKELCGRIGAMKLCYTPDELARRKFYLVIDGFFDDSDLVLLDRAGWDGIFYFDELDKLIESIEQV